jgi:predicted nucleic acid-binding protein
MENINCENSFLVSYKVKHALQGVVDGRFQMDILPLIQHSDIEKTTVVPCKKCAACYDYEFYTDLFYKFHNKKILSLKELKIELHKWRKIELEDEVRTHSVPKKTPEFSATLVTTDKKIIYIDQNILSLYRNGGDFSLSIHNLKKQGVQFVYSPSHLEEIYKIEDKKDQNDFLNSIRNLTDNLLFIRSTKGYILVKEDPNFSLERIKNYTGTTEALEELKVVSSKDRELFLEKYNTEDHKKKVGQNNTLLARLSKEDFAELMHYSSSLFTKISEFKNINSKEMLIHAVHSLSVAFDLISYKTDKKERTIKSNIHDIEHLIYASHADYFVTRDKKLRNRAKQIFEVLGKNVIVLSKEELESLQIST